MERIISWWKHPFLWSKNHKSNSIKKQREEEARDRYNIVRINGTDYITYLNIVVTRKGDTDLLDRIEEFRQRYINGDGRE